MYARSIIYFVDGEEKERGRDLLASTSAVREHMSQAVWLVPTKSWSPSPPLSRISTPVTLVRTRRFPARQYRRGIHRGGSRDNNWILCNNSSQSFFFASYQYRITRSRWFLNLFCVLFIFYDGFKIWNSKNSVWLIIEHYYRDNYEIKRFSILR